MAEIDRNRLIANLLLNPRFNASNDGPAQTGEPLLDDATFGYFNNYSGQNNPAYAAGITIPNTGVDINAAYQTMPNEHKQDRFGIIARKTWNF